MNELELFRTDVPEQCTPEQARDLTDRIKLVLDGMWELVKAAYTSRAWSALGYPTWDEYCTREFGTSRIRLPREERGEVIGSLRDSGLSVRAIAAATGLSRGTIGNELAEAGVQNWTPEVEVTREPVAPHPVERPQQESAPSTRPPAVRPATKGLDGKTYQSTRPAPVYTPPANVPPPLFPADNDVVDAEIVDPEAPAPWIENAAREAAEQIAEVKAEFDDAAQREAELAAMPGAETFDQRIRREQPYANAAIKIRQAIEEIPLHMDPADLANRVPDYSEHNVNRLPEALAWLAAFSNAYKDRRAAVA